MPNNNEDSLIEEIHTKMIYEFSKTLELFNLTPSEAMQLSTLYLSKKPMTLDEMAIALGKSKTSMSTGIRSLLDANLVERVWKKGERKDYFRVKENLYEKMMKSYIQKWMDNVVSQKQTFIELKGHLPESNIHTQKDQVNFLNERMQEMIEFHLKIEKIFNR